MSTRDELGEAGQIIVEGDLASLVFRRRLMHPPEAVWKAITDPAELSNWYLAEGTIDGREGGTVDMREGPYRLHVTGRILTWDPPRVFEHEWKVAPRPGFPGEDSVIRWELARDGKGTMLRLEHRNLRRQTALGFAPGAHAFLDRLGAQLSGRPPEDWQERVGQLASQYPPSWVTR